MPTQQIKSRYDGTVLYECEAESLSEALRRAVVMRVNLWEADLQGANLIGANLQGANLQGANLIGANLIGANLIGANLTGANLQGANLQGANLQGVKVNWTSHVLIAEILRQHAGDDVAKWSIAGLVAASLDWRWDRFLSIDMPQREWAFAVLRGYVQEGDDAPDMLRERNE